VELRHLFAQLVKKIKFSMTPSFKPVSIPYTIDQTSFKTILAHTHLLQVISSV